MEAYIFNILTIDKLVVHTIGIAMYKINNGLFPSVLNELYKKNNVIHDHNTRTKGCTVKRAQEKGRRKRARKKDTEKLAQEKWAPAIRAQLKN